MKRYLARREATLSVRIVSLFALVLGMSSPSHAMEQGYSAPPLGGTYQPFMPGQHPFVFTTQARMMSLLATNTPASSAALARLESGVKSDLTGASLTDHAARHYIGPYSGETIWDGTCDDYCGQFASTGGAASIAADLATYAYLTSLNQGYGDRTLAAQAQAFARDILLTWATTGFLRDSNHGLIQDSTKYVGVPEKTPDPNSVSFFFSTAMTSWAQAQDLLVATGALSLEDQANLEAFLVSMEGLIVNSLPHTFDPGALGGDPASCRFGNQKSVQLLGSLAIAQLRRDQATIESFAYDKYGTTLVPWTLQVQQNIYGVDARLVCPSGSQIPTVAPGEILDRFRPGTNQTFGYPALSLDALLMAGEILQNDGFEALGYQGSQHQSLLMAAKYYDYYFGSFPTDQATVVPKTSGPKVQTYSSYDQYIGKDVSYRNGVTITAVDQTNNVWLTAERDYPGTAFNALNRAKQFSRAKVVAFSAVDSMHIDRLADPDLASSGLDWRFDDLAVNFPFQSVGPTINSEGWQGGPNGQLTIVSPSTGGLELQTTGGDAQLWSPPLNVCAGTPDGSCSNFYNELDVTLSADQPLLGNLVQIFWDAGCGPGSAADCYGFDEQHAMGALLSVDQTPTTYVFNTGAVPNWGPRVYRLRIDPTTTTGSTLHVHDVSLK